jgi:hypothetical protein
MSTPLGDVAAEFAQLASSLVDRWTERLATIATNVDDGSYTADDAAGDLAATTSLAVQSGLQLVSGVIDAIAIVAPHKSVDASTPLLESPLAGAALSIEAPFVNLDASGSLFPSQIAIQPRQLGAHEVHFQLSAPAQSCEPGLYVGSVTATLVVPGSPPQVASIRVLLPVQ